MTDQKQEGLLKWHPMLARKTTVPISSPPSPPCETVVLANGAVPSNARPPATTSATLGSEKNPSATQTPCSIEITVELAQGLKPESLSSPMTVSRSHSELLCGGPNALTAVTVLESEVKTIQYSPRLIHTNNGARGLKAAGQRETQGQCQGQTSFVYGGTGRSKGPSTRGTGNACAKPSASWLDYVRKASKTLFPITAYLCSWHRMDSRWDHLCDHTDQSQMAIVFWRNMNRLNCSGEKNIDTTKDIKL